MTINQINIILTAAKEGTISAAAKALGLSQPNVSSGIKAVEEEIGFAIFARNSTGIRPTEKGRLFLEHAQNISAETSLIMDIGKQDPILQLRIAHTSSSAAFNAFQTICREKMNTEKAELKITSCALDDGIKLLSQHEIDVLVTITFHNDHAILSQFAEDFKFDQIKIKDLTASLNLRKDHPIFSTGLMGNAEEGFQIDMKGKKQDALLKELSRYPMAYYEKFNINRVPFQTFRMSSAPCSYLILVDSIEDRQRLVSTTNAFSMSITMSEEIKKQYNLTSIPIAGYESEMYCFVRSGEISRTEISRYISILKSLT